MQGNVDVQMQIVFFLLKQQAYFWVPINQETWELTMLKIWILDGVNLGPWLMQGIWKYLVGDL